MTRTNQAGRTLLEVVFAAAVIAVAMGVAVLALLTGQRTFVESMRRTAVDEEAARVMALIVADLRQTGPSGSNEINSSATDTDDDDDDSDMDLQPGAAASSVKFRPAKAWDATNLRTDWGTFVTYTWSKAATPTYKLGETINGVDDNGNGLVDEGFITKTYTDPSTNQVVTKVVAVDVLADSMPNADGSWTTISSSTPTTIRSDGLASHGFRFERGTSPSDDQVLVIVTVAAQLSDRTICTRQLREVVLLRD
jgi:type II secretory pathway pseudopilin PulG